MTTSSITVPVANAFDDVRILGALAAARNDVAAIQVPRRQLLTKTLANGLSLRSAFPGGTCTFLAVIPIEAPCYAVRLGFANNFNNTQTISKCSVYPSDSYSVLTGAALTEGSPGGTNRAVVPTGGAAGCPIYFDNAGAWNQTINTAGSTRSFTMAANAGNAGNANQAFTIQWSDLVPCTSIARADGGTQHLLFIYVTTTTTGTQCPGVATANVMNGNALAARGGRYFWYGQAWSGGTDYADNPTGTGFKQFNLGPYPVAIQYLSATPGIQVVATGDSLSCAPTNDNFTVPLMRAGWDLSTPTLPIEYASTAWGGTGSAVYDVTLANNLPALRPSIIAHQPLSRNDTFSVAGLQTLLAKSLGLADAGLSTCGAQTIWNIAGCTPSADGNSPQIAAFNDMRSRLLALSSTIGVPVIDAPSVVGNVAGSAPWDYLSGLSDDNTHPNYTGAELIVPLAKAALRTLIGI